MNKKLTREKAISLHREMWTDMQAELGDDPGPFGRIDFKKEWVRKHFLAEEVASNCFLCEYAKQLKESKGIDAHYKCDYCPIEWNSAVFCHPTCCPGIWDVWERDMVDYRYSPISVILALPEREVGE